MSQPTELSGHTAGSNRAAGSDPDAGAGGTGGSGRDSGPGCGSGSGPTGWRERLRERIGSGDITAAVVGLGYVGLPLVEAMHEAGLRVIGFDIDGEKIEKLRRGESYIRHPGPELAARLAGSERFRATGDAAELGRADVVVLCVPTPLGPHREPDLGYVTGSARTVAGQLRGGQLIVLESTTYPGTTRGEVGPILAEAASARGLELGRDVFVAYSPEREDPGRRGIRTAQIPKLVGGLDSASLELAAMFYRRFIESVHEVASAEVAEAAKLLENIYRAVNIALVNELKVILERLGIDVWDVIEAAKTKPFGFQAFYPGPGLGGHCIPIDPFYLTWKAKEVGQSTRFIELAGQINHQMPGYVIDRTVGALNDQGKAVKGAKVLVLGLAYKPNVDDVRESPSFELIRRLRQLGAEVSYNDPHVPATHAMRHYPDLPPMQSVELTEQALNQSDCVLIATKHDAYDWAWVAKHAGLIVDSRGATRGVASPRAVIVPA